MGQKLIVFCPGAAGATGFPWAWLFGTRTRAKVTIYRRKPPTFPNHSDSLIWWPVYKWSPPVQKACIPNLDGRQMTSVEVTRIHPGPDRAKDRKGQATQPSHVSSDDSRRGSLGGGSIPQHSTAFLVFGCPSRSASALQMCHPESSRWSPQLLFLNSAVFVVKPTFSPHFPW